TVNILPQKMSNASENILEVIPEISAYPNPATNYLTAKFSGYDGNLTVQVFDLFGKLIFRATVNSEDLFRLDVRQLSSGAYFLYATDDQGHTASLKWVKE